MSPLSKYVTFVLLFVYARARRGLLGTLFFFFLGRSTSNTHDQNGSSDTHEFIVAFSFADRACGMNWVSCRVQTHAWAHIRLMWTPNVLMRTYTYLVRLSTYLATAKCTFFTSFFFSVFDFVLPLHRNTYSLFNHAQKRAANVWRKTAFRRYSSTRPWYGGESESFCVTTCPPRVVLNAYIHIPYVFMLIDIFADDCCLYL